MTITSSKKLPLRARMMAIQASGSRLAIALAPTLSKIPYPMQRYDDSFFPYTRTVIDVTSDLVAAYVFDLAAYLSVGASGAIALERSLAYVPKTCLTVLHGPFTRPEYAGLITDMAFRAECATLQPTDQTAMSNLIDAFLTSASGVFLMNNEPEAEFPHDRIGVMQRSQLSDPLAPDHWLHLSGEPSLDWGCYGDSLAFASRGEDFQTAVRSAALTRRDWLEQNVSQSLPASDDKVYP